MTDDRLAGFRRAVLERGSELYRDLPWRRSRDPYEVWVSEAMLQQTQVARVDGRWQRWLERFPTVDALAAASTADVLDEWQGLGYNRRAVALLRAAQAISASGGRVPSDRAALVALPGVGASTAAGIRAFAFDLPATYLETNVRAVFLHELFPTADRVSDSELLPLVEATCPPDSHDPADDPRTWYFSLLDYGAWLKRSVPNPSRRSSSHVRQSRFEGSHRQRRAQTLRILLAHGEGATLENVCQELIEEDKGVGRIELDADGVLSILEELRNEGMCTLNGDRWQV